LGEDPPLPAQNASGYTRNGHVTSPICVRS
jgi:hypothetical protein